MDMHSHRDIVLAMFSHSQGSCTAARYTRAMPFRQPINRAMVEPARRIDPDHPAYGTSQAAMTVENHWLFEMGGGNFVRVQVYADTAAGYRAAS